jgi:anti-sigma factor RsiW
MDHERAREAMLDERRGGLEATRVAELDAHVAACADCRHEREAERALSEALARMPRHEAPAALKRRLEAKVDEAAPAAHTRWRVSALVLAAAAILVAAFLSLRGSTPAAPPSPLVAEAVNDHLRVLYAEHPIEVQSGGIHQVKPWFAGRLDFAPIVGFGGDDDFPLEGGSVAYFMDRKAAAFLFKRRLHVITLLVMRSDGLTWPAPELAVGRVRAHAEDSRGFHALLWHDGDLGYALVSDADPRELRALAGKIVGQ